MSETLGELQLQGKLPDLNRPRWDQNTYTGRARHFLTTVNPLNIFATPSTLNNSKVIVNKYKNRDINPNMSVDELWKAKQLYDSAFHPDTGEKMLMIGRMSFQVYGNMTITGGMLTFYTKSSHVIFWQWINQSFNAIVNFTNRSGSNPVSKERLFVSYCCATGGALATALSLNSLVKDSNTLRGRLVPFAAIALANMVNIPMMRSNEFAVGIPVEDDKGNVLGNSLRVPKIAIPQVVLSRIGMAIPSFVGIPLIMQAISKKDWYKSRPWMSTPIQTVLAGLFLTFSTPLCCALFPQKAAIRVSLLEPELREYIEALPNAPKYVYYNKGL